MKESFCYIFFHGTCGNIKNAFYISINVKCDCLFNILQAATISLGHISKQMGKLLCRHKAMKLKLQKNTLY